MKYADKYPHVFFMDEFLDDEYPTTVARGVFAQQVRDGTRDACACVVCAEITPFLVRCGQALSNVCSTDCRKVLATARGDNRKPAKPGWDSELRTFPQDLKGDFMIHEYIDLDAISRGDVSALEPGELPEALRRAAAALAVI